MIAARVVDVAKTMVIDTWSHGCAEMPNAHAFEVLIVRVPAAVATRDQRDTP